ncbi:MAG: hypothetical protein M3336_00695, partial [Chloroflexota bacterium]|nr:hypothetical protein [Chloroflexota bacterium]
AQGLAAILAWRAQPGARAVLVALLAAGATFVPWLPILAEQTGAIGGDFWIQPPRLSTLWVTFRELAAHTPPDEPFFVPLRIGYAVQSALLLVGAALVARDPRQRVALLTGIVPIGLAWAVSLAAAPIYAVRYISPVGLAFAFLLARGVTALPRRAAVLAGVLAFVPVALSLPALYTDPGYSRSDLRSAARAVRTQRGPNELVLHLADFTATPFAYYGVAPPTRVLQTDDRGELCRALRPHPGGWLVTAYAAADEAARHAAEGGIQSSSYAGDLLLGEPLRFLGASVFHLSSDC